MNRSCLRNKFLKTRSDLDRKPYNKQRKGKKPYYSNLNTNVLTENGTFWKTVKPFLADKTNKTSRITLIEEERVISQDHLIAIAFNEYFISIPIKNMPKYQEYERFDSSEEDPVSSITDKYRNHPSIKLIKTKKNPIHLDLRILILMRSKSLSKN